MDKGDVSLQVISHGSLIASSSACLGANDELAVAISKNSKLLARFAMLLMQDPKAAAWELARCVKELGFVGALVATASALEHFQGNYDRNWYCTGCLWLGIAY
jgi:predicted TIM-barrel fold metal-dependent hydrolase